MAKIKQDSAIKIIRPSAAERNVTLSEVFGRAARTQNLATFTPSHAPTNPPSKQTVYAHEKNRTDAKQMPISFFYSQNMPRHSEEEEELFPYRFPECGRDSEVRNFFLECSYVGCFGLNYILIH